MHSATAEVLSSSVTASMSGGKEASMRRMLILAAWLLCIGSSAFGQTITQQPTGQSVLAGQPAVFSVSFTGGPCRSIWYTGAVGNQFGTYGPSPITFSIPNATLAMNGTGVAVKLYGCTGGADSSISSIATLTVTPAVRVSISALYEDGTVPPGVEVVVNQIVSNPDGTVTSTPALQLVPDATSGAASGLIALDPAITYQAVLYRNGIEVGEPLPYPVGLMLAVMPKISKVNFGVVLAKDTGLVDSFTSGAS
jgi:hypothetical protein